MDDDGFWQVMEGEIPWMHRQVRRLGAAAMDAEDLVQEVCIRVYERWSSRDPERPIRPWLYAFLFRVTSDYRRRARRRHPHVSDEALVAPDASDVGGRDRALLLRALEVLSDEQRHVFLLVDLEEHPVTEAAEILGIPLNTAYTRLRRARVALRDEVLRLRGPE